MWSTDIEISTELWTSSALSILQTCSSLCCSTSQHMLLHGTCHFPPEMLKQSPVTFTEGSKSLGVFVYASVQRGVELELGVISKAETRKGCQSD